jgi:hypothetical protein
VTLGVGGCADYHATECRSWRLWFSADGARAARLPTPVAAEGLEAAHVSARGTANELVMFCYGASRWTRCSSTATGVSWTS